MNQADRDAARRYPAVCLGCGHPLDLGAIGELRRAGREVVHDCGCLLVAAKAPITSKEVTLETPTPR